MFVDAKYAIRKDLHDMRRMRLVVEMYKKDCQFEMSILCFMQPRNPNGNSTDVQKRLSLYYWFEKSVKKRLNEDCIWSREGCYTWNQAYDRVHQWAQWFLAQGVKPKDLVAFHMVNSPDFILAWLGLWAVGAAPAMINYNLQGKALLHCLKVSGATLLVTDLEIAKNIEDCRGDIEGDLGMTIQIIDPAAMSYIRGLAPERPADKHREKVQGDWPMAIFYTRFVS
jgi:acyl-CoA synthetase (AMP-forming)/AMP-acid ligase II